MAVLAAIALAISGAGIIPAAVAGTVDGEHGPGDSRSVRVSGRQIPVDVDKGLYTMRGSLVGDWEYIPREVLHDQPTLYVEAGVEVFTGCIDRRPRDGKCTERDHRGELHLTFLYWASFDASGNLIRGQCTHPITGGKGAFAGARGLLTMVDRPVGDEVRTTYRGRIALNAVPGEGDAETPSAAATAAAAAAATVDRVGTATSSVATATGSERRAC
jgi:hypothetical protein